MSISLAALGSATFTGRNGSSGPISVPGLKVGDKAILIYDAASGFSVSNGNLFELVISIADEIQQTDAVDNLSRSFTVFFFRET